MISAIVQYFKEAQAELKKVIWPRRQETMRHTVAVVVTSLSVALLFFLLDRLFVTLTISVFGI